MIKKLQKRFALSEQGAKDTIIGSFRECLSEFNLSFPRRSALPFVYGFECRQGTKSYHCICHRLRHLSGTDGCFYMASV